MSYFSACTEILNFVMLHDLPRLDPLLTIAEFTKLPPLLSPPPFLMTYDYWHERRFFVWNNKAYLLKLLFYKYYCIWWQLHSKIMLWYEPHVFIVFNPFNQRGMPADSKCGARWIFKSNTCWLFKSNSYWLFKSNSYWFLNPTHIGFLNPTSIGFLNPTPTDFENSAVKLMT